MEDVSGKKHLFKGLQIGAYLKSGSQWEKNHDYVY